MRPFTVNRCEGAGDEASGELCGLVGNIFGRLSFIGT